MTFAYHNVAVDREQKSSHTINTMCVSFRINGKIMVVFHYGAIQI